MTDPFYDIAPASRKAPDNCNFAAIFLSVIGFPVLSGAGMSPRTVLAATAVFLFSLAGIFARAQSEAPRPITVIHMVAGKQFNPKTATISVGDTVEWVNDDAQNLHNVTTDRNATDIPKAIQMPKGAKPFNSGLMTPGKHYRYKFTVPGTYRYVCVPHQPDMIGTIVVEAK